MSSMHTRKAFTFCSSTHVTVSLLWQNFLTVAYIDTKPLSIPDLLKHIQTFICLVGIRPLSTSGWFYDHWETATLGVDPCWSNWTLSLAVFIKQAAVHHHSPQHSLHPPCIFNFSPVTFQNETPTEVLSHKSMLNIKTITILALKRQTWQTLTDKS